MRFGRVGRAAEGPRFAASGLTTTLQPPEARAPRWAPAPVPRRMPPPPSALDLPNLPDADVVALAQKGREAAFRELIRRYERPVFSLIYRMVRDSTAAEDLAQDSFIKVLNHIDKYRPEFKFSSWLFKIANNIAIDHLRRRQLDTISMDGSPHAMTASDVEGARAEVEIGAAGGAAPVEAMSATARQRRSIPSERRRLSRS